MRAVPLPIQRKKPEPLGEATEGIAKGVRRSCGLALRKAERRTQSEKYGIKISEQGASLQEEWRSEGGKMKEVEEEKQTEIAAGNGWHQRPF